MSYRVLASIIGFFFLFSLSVAKADKPIYKYSMLPDSCQKASNDCKTCKKDQGKWKCTLVDKNDKKPCVANKWQCVTATASTATVESNDPDPPREE
jgi:hypothetical protein